MEYEVFNKIFFKSKKEAEEFTRVIGGYISIPTYDYWYYGKDYVKGKTIVDIRASRYFMESLKDFGVKRKRVNGKVVYEFQGKDEA